MAKQDRFEGLDADRITDDTKLARMSASFAEGKHTELEDFPAERAMLFKMQKMNDEIKELHRFLGSEVTSNTATNLSVSAGGSGLRINSSDGNNADVPAATTSAWGAMTDENFDAIAANTAKAGAVGFYPGSPNYIWVPGSHFNGPTLNHQGLKVGDSDTRGKLYYEWPGIAGKSVTAIKVYTSAAVSRGVKVDRIRATHATVTTTLASNSNTNADIDITDWVCTMGETILVTVILGSTSKYIHGMHLVIG
tara:strand:+ start:4850 stop:5602 length:753 start_codon:yes stop_codon:yes gene_type:complete